MNNKAKEFIDLLIMNNEVLENVSMPPNKLLKIVELNIKGQIMANNDIIKKLSDGKPIADTESKCNKHDVARSYCVKRHVFFASTDPIIADNLTEKEADKKAKTLNTIEEDKPYTWYQVHNCG